ncbi:MAG: hypothetical protein KAT77_02165 [Nanoarchaeota archaeon]|nr:hypothetical protein [Nanoarchaeota archaeon]
MKRKKKGQLEIGFNWIYILIAGAVILMFFVGIVIKQKVVSEQKLSAEVLRSIEGIFTGAGLSEKTTGPVDIPELTMRFVCDDETGYSDYSVEGSGVRAETPWQPIFSPTKIKTKKLLTWTLEWKFPFQVSNYLFLSSPEIKYYIFSDEYLLPNLFNFEYNVITYDQVKYTDEEQIRLVFFGDLLNNGVLPFDHVLRDVPDEKVTAVLFRGEGVVFYEKQDDSFVQLGEEVPLIPSTMDENANLYAAIFSTDPDAYACNLKKGLKRLEILSKIYGKRIKAIQDDYFLIDSLSACAFMIDEDLFYGASLSLEDIAQRCQEDITNCVNIKGTADEIEGISSNFIANTACPVIY